jgi:hypothetical protein
MIPELKIESCPHIRNNKMKVHTVVRHTANPEVSHAELNTETRLCTICSAPMASILTNFEKRGEATEPDDVFGPPTEEELTGIIEEMKQIAQIFYMLCTKAGLAHRCHPFLEFTGLMREYIHGCTMLTREGSDFRRSSGHSNKESAQLPIDIRYIAEKLNCIFGPTLRAGESKELFLKLMGLV